VVGRLESEASVKKISAAVSHHEREVAELQADRELAVEYLFGARHDLRSPPAPCGGQ
jgi:hypothetical protein